jgi:hypothetical protein
MPNSHDVVITPKNTQNHIDRMKRLCYCKNKLLQKQKSSKNTLTTRLTFVNALWRIVDTGTGTRNILSYIM